MNFLNKIKKNSYFKSILTLMSGSMIAQIFTLVCSPILTRIVSPETLGVYSLVTGAITMFGTVMSARYELCVVSERDERKVFPLINLSFFICVFLSVAIGIGYTIYFKSIQTAENFVVLALITAALSFLIGIINLLTAYNNRQRDYKLITKTYVTRIFAQNICNIAAGLLNLGGIGLSVSHFIGYCAGVRGQIVPLLKEKKKLFAVTREAMIEVAKENKNQAVMSAPAALANGLGYSLINYFIEALYTTAVVGYYSISYRILGLPATIISGNVSRVFLEKASNEYKEKGNFWRIYKQTVLILFAMGIPMGICMMIFAPWACELVFGTGWSVSGIYIRILTPMFILRFIAGGVNCSAIIVNKQYIDLIIQLILTFSVVTIFLVSKWLALDVEVFLQILNLVSSAIYIAYILLFGICARAKKA